MTFIILDRDGVINHNSGEYIKSPDEWIPIPGSLEAIAALNRQGFKVFIATNQSGVARGYYDIEMLDSIHEKFVAELASVGGYIEEIFFCPHHPDEACSCRKPKPGLLHQIEEKYNVPLANTFFIGDSEVDVEAAFSAGCLPLLVRTGNGERTLKKFPQLIANVPHFSDLADAVQAILKNHLLRRLK